MSEQRFKTTLEADERGRVRVIVPFDPHAIWGRRARHHVAGTLAGVEFETSLGARGGQFFFPVAKELQRDAGVAPGDEVAIVLRAAEAKTAALPADLAAALERTRSARAFFDGLTPFAKNQWIGWIESAKRAETRTARVASAIAGLAAGQKLPRG